MRDNTGIEPLSSQPASSQPQFLNEAKLPRHLFKIQAKQRNLLNSPSSWAQIASRGPKPGVNLPPEVLENLRDFHRRRQKAASPGVNLPPEVLENLRDFHRRQQKAASPSQEPTNDGQNSNAGVDHPPEVESGSDHEGLEESNPVASQVSWSPSPTPSPRRPQAQPEERFASQSPVREQDADLDEMYSQTLPEQPFVTQVSAESPPQPTSDARSTLKRPAFTDFPSSSLGIEEPLEIVAPGAVTEQAPSANKSANLDPTPPSAQVQVPCTFEPDSSVSGPREKQAGKRPYVELASIQTVQRRIANSKQKADVAGRSVFAQNIGGHATGIDDSQSSEGSASSVVPATNTMRPGYSPVRSPNLFPVISTVKETPYIPRRPSIQSRAGSPPAQLEDSPPAFEQASPRRLSPEFRPASPQLRFPSPKTGSAPEAQPQSSPVRRHFTTRGSSSNPQTQAPFIRYCLSYPSYAGSIGDFVKACIYIKVLQRKRALASYQYDDFVRAWIQGYLPYIETLSESEEPLTAIEWYMEMVDAAEYTKRILTRENLESTLVFYADEVRSARQSLGILSSQSSADVRTPSIPKEAPQPNQVTHRGSEPVNLHSTVNGGSGLVQETRKPLRRSTSIQEQPGSQRPELPLDHQSDKATPGISPPVPSKSDREQQPASVSSRSVISKVPQKRSSDNDKTGQPSPKRALLEPSTPSQSSSRDARVTASPAGGVRSRPTSSTAEPKKTAQNLERQTLHWKKYLAKRKAQRISDSISIASSAPPRSAQKE